MDEHQWGGYFLRIAKEVGSNSKCLSRKIGALIVKDNRIVATGYNGPPEGIPHCDEEGAFFVVHNEGKRIEGCPRRAAGIEPGQGLDKCPAVHAERNALLTAAKFGVPTDGATLVCWCPPPCQDCVKEIIQAGIKKIICLSGSYYDYMSEWLLENSDIELVKYGRYEIFDWE
jgi:dCMP deaminase